MTNSELKQLINNAYEMADVMYQTPYGQLFSQLGVKPFRELIMIDLCKYVSYLGNIKGVATEREVVLYKDCYREPYSNIGLRQVQNALDINLEGDNFNNELPLLLQAYLSIDVEMSKQGIDKKGTSSRLYIDLFIEIGAFFLEYYNEVNPKELFVVQQYISMLEEGRNSKLSGVIDDEFLKKEKTNEQHQEANENNSQSNKKIDRTFDMGKKGESTKDKLLRSFDALKNNFTKNSKSIADIVSKMFAIDKDMAIDMWVYLFNEYKIELEKSDAFDLTGGIFSGGCRAIGETEMDEIVIKNSIIKEAMFFYNRSVQFSCYRIIQRKIMNNDLQIADELLELMYNNEARKDHSSWYEIMDYVIPNSQVSREANELLEMWCEKVDDVEERAKLLVELIKYDE